MRLRFSGPSFPHFCFYNTPAYQLFSFFVLFSFKIVKSLITYPNAKLNVSTLRLYFVENSLYESVQFQSTCKQQIGRDKLYELHIEMSAFIPELIYRSSLLCQVVRFVRLVLCLSLFSWLAGIILHLEGKSVQQLCYNGL